MPSSSSMLNAGAARAARAGSVDDDDGDVGNGDTRGAASAAKPIGAGASMIPVFVVEIVELGGWFRSIRRAIALPRCRRRCSTYWQLSLAVRRSTRVREMLPPAIILPAPAGPTSAITLVPLDCSACDSPFLRAGGRRVACRAASALQTDSVGLFHKEGKGGGTRQQLPRLTPVATTVSQSRHGRNHRHVAVADAAARVEGGEAPGRGTRAGSITRGLDRGGRRLFMASRLSPWFRCSAFWC